MVVSEVKKIAMVVYQKNSNGCIRCKKIEMVVSDVKKIAIVVSDITK